MKVKLETEINKDGLVYEKGFVLDVPKQTADVWIKKGWATKEQKSDKETKEHKTNKETK